MQHIDEVQPTAQRGKAALVEAISMTPEIKEAICSENLNSTTIYRLACEQLQYETLPAAGVRAVQGMGCSLPDCMSGLDSSTDPQAFPGLRARLAKEHGLTLLQVADAIDAFCRADADGTCLPLENFMSKAGRLECAA